MARRVIDAETPGLVTTHRKEVERPFRGSKVNPNARACHALGDTCPNMAMPNGTCHAHGGRTPSGMSASRYVHGRYSKLAHAAPQYLSEGMERAMEDLPGLVDLSEALSLQWSTIADLLQKLPTGESGETWRALREHSAEYQKAKSIVSGGASGKRFDDAKHTMDEALQSMLYLIEEGAQEWQQRRDIGTEIDRLAGVANIEGKRRERATDTMAMYVVKRLLCIIQENVTDLQDRTKIQREVQSLFTGK